jgi:protein-L-isoaspartate(D-aspartate) O-methyltransferase
VPPAWVTQLEPTGRLVVPLQVRGLSRTIAFDKADGCLVSRSARLFGFLPMQGAGARPGKLLVMRGGEITVRFDDDFPFDPNALEDVFDTPRVEVWSGATIGRFEPWASAQMWLATALRGFCRVVLDKKLDSGLISPPGNHSAAVGVVDGGSLAYVTTRSTPDEADVEFGVHAFGPDAETLAEKVAEQLRVWARDHRTGHGPQFRVYPAATANDLLPHGRVVDKKHSRITISWPAKATGTRCDTGSKGP